MLGICLFHKYNINIALYTAKEVTNIVTKPIIRASYFEANEILFQFGFRLLSTKINLWLREGCANLFQPSEIDCLIIPFLKKKNMYNFRYIPLSFFSP